MKKTYELYQIEKYITKIHERTEEIITGWVIIATSPNFETIKQEYKRESKEFYKLKIPLRVKRIRHEIIDLTIKEVK